MTHYAVIIAADDPDDVEALMAPFYEDIEVPPYRDYFDWRREYAEALAFYREHPEYWPEGTDPDDVAAVVGAPEHEPVYTEGAGDGDRARSEYYAQPLVQALKGTRFEERLWIGPCPVERFSVARAEYVRRERARAVPATALVTREGEWVAPGREVGFPALQEPAEVWNAYLDRANAYIDALGGDAYLFAADCHI